MNILVVNTGSSSIKYQLIAMEGPRVMAAGLAERIGDGGSRLRHHAWPENPERCIEHVEERRIADHADGMQRIAEALTDSGHGVIHGAEGIDGVGHRVVHGGEHFQAPAWIDSDVIEGIRANIPLAPLHNPPNLTGIEVARELFPDAPQVAVFDTAFHQGMPPRAYHYALPHELYERHHLRRYGFHGTSHAWVAREAAAFLGRSLDELNLITLHLGNGASATAIEGGRSIDTSMGLTPLEGLIMGTRCGDIDPATHSFLADREGLSLAGIDNLLNKQSGLKGICGSGDLRDIEQKAADGDERARLALDMYVYRIRKYVGAYWAILGRVDALVFTAGVGENSATVRSRVCDGLQGLGMRLQAARNEDGGTDTRAVHADGSSAAILIVPTNEELAIARETERLIA